MWSKDKVKVLMERHRLIYRASRYLYTCVRHPERLPKKKSYGPLNDDTTIFVIRPNSEDGVQGLMSLFAQTVCWIDYAQKKNYIPYVDFRTYKTQYYCKDVNVWEYFFTQPSSLTYDEVYQSKHVICSGPMLFDDVDYHMFGERIFYDSALCLKCCRAIQDHISLSREVNDLVAKEAELLGIDHCIGVFIRGTDYVALKPTGEHIQPAIEDVIKKLDEFLRRYPDANLFLVTEDYNYYSVLSSRFKDKLKVTSYDTFIKNYEGKDFLSKSNVLKDDKKARGAEYLAKVALLSKCRYFVGSIAMGSITAYAMNGKKYSDEYVFDLGLYP